MIGTEVKQYRITKSLGHGGMGDVYEAHDLELDRKVAIKCMRPDLMHSEDITTRFRNEARTLASLRHPNIATVHRFFEQDGVLFLVMEFIPGKPFEKLISKGVMLPDRSVPLVQQALSGLGYAHEHNIVHRDVKPANLMLDGHGTVKVLDFGIAHIIGESKLTSTGMMIGTPGYMAPEQVLGQQVDQRTDLYAMGIVLYQMLTGQLPFVGNSQHEAQQAHFQERPAQLKMLFGRVPGPLHDAVLHAIAKDGGDRYQTAKEFSSALGQTLTGMTSAPPTLQRPDEATIIRDPNTGATLPAGHTQGKSSGGTGRLMAGVGVAALALAAAGGYLYLQPSGPVQSPVESTQTKRVDEASPPADEAADSNPAMANPQPATVATTDDSTPSSGEDREPEFTTASLVPSRPPAIKPTPAIPAQTIPQQTAPTQTGQAQTQTVKTVPAPAIRTQPAPVQAPASQSLTLAVVDFTASRPTSYSASLAEIVVDELVNRSKFDVLEREKLSSLSSELKFQNESGFVSPDSAVQIGNMLGARFLVTGHVLDQGTSSKKYTGYGITTTKITSRLKARLEVIDLSTGAKLFSKVAQASREAQVVQGSQVGGADRNLGTKVAKDLVTAMLAAPRVKEMVEGPELVTIDVNSSPPDADVEVDGTYYGTAGAPLNLLPGTHQIRVSLPGYTAWEKRVLVRKGTKLMARLQKVDITRTETSIRVETN